MNYYSALIAFMIGTTGLLGFASSQDAPATRHCIVQNGKPVEADIQGDKAFLDEGLKEHNLRRKEHGVPPLTLNQNLCKSAQVTANFNLEDDKLIHTKNMDRFKGATVNCGENLYTESMTGAPLTVTAADVVKAWYDEIKDYDWKTEKSKNTEPVGHFTQVVWKGTREMCMTFSKITPANPGDKQSVYVAAHYFPPGNYVGKNKENVLKSGSGSSQSLLNLAAACAAFFAVLISTSQY